MGRSPSPNLEENKAFVRGLTEDVDESMITSYFSKYGRVTEVYLARDFETKLPRGFAFVTYENSKDCENACKSLNGKDFHGKPLHVEKSAKPRGGGSRGFRGSRGRGGFSSRGGHSPPVGRDYDYRSRQLSSRDDRSFPRNYRRPFTPRGSRGRAPSPVREYEYRSRVSPLPLPSRADKYYGEAISARDSRYYRDGYESYPKGVVVDYARPRYEASDFRAPRTRHDYSPPTARREYETAPRGEYYDYPAGNGRFSPVPSRREYEIPRSYGSYSGSGRVSSGYATGPRGASPPPRAVARDYQMSSGSAVRRQAMRSVSPPPKRIKSSVDAYEARRSPAPRSTAASRRF